MLVSDAISINEVLKELSTKDLPFKTAVAVAKNLKSLECVLSVFEQKRTAIITDNAKRDEDGNVVYTNPEHTQVQLDDVTKVNEEITKLLNEEVELVIGSMHFDNTDSLNIAPKLLTPILDYIE